MAWAEGGGDTLLHPRTVVLADCEGWLGDVPGLVPAHVLDCESGPTRNKFFSGCCVLGLFVVLGRIRKLLRNI